MSAAAAVGCALWVEVGRGSCRKVRGQPWAGGRVPAAGPQLGTALGSLGVAEWRGASCHPSGPFHLLLLPLPSSSSCPTAKGCDSSKGARPCPGRVCAAIRSCASLRMGSASAVERRCSKALIIAERGGEKKRHQKPYWQTNTSLSGGKTDFAEMGSCTCCGFWPY